jgi:HTH-type transcriptional regulator/antitoxin HigA
VAETNTQQQLARAGVAYLELVRRCPLRPIRSEAELDRAIAMIDRLVDRDTLDPDAADYLDVLSDLVEKYEAKHHPIDTSDLTDAEMLAHLIEARAIGQVEVSRGTGIAESTISEILAGKRQLNRRQIGKLAAYFHVEPGVFNFPPAPRPPKRKARR